MVLYNDTLLRSFLAHLQSNARQMAALMLERSGHTDEPYVSPAQREIRDCWESLRRDLIIVLGPEAQLKPFTALAHPGSFSESTTGKDTDCFRITLKALKLLADKARRSHPEVTLLKSWNIAAKERPKDED